MHCTKLGSIVSWFSIATGLLFPFGTYYLLPYWGTWPTLFFTVVVMFGYWIAVGVVLIVTGNYKCNEQV